MLNKEVSHTGKGFKSLYDPIRRAEERDGLDG
jgi:hypothetical protein